MSADGKRAEDATIRLAAAGALGITEQGVRNRLIALAAPLGRASSVARSRAEAGRPDAVW